jgi:hypothetical protein
MNKKITGQTWALVILIIGFIYLVSLSLMSKGLYGDADSMAHYMLARHAFKYPYHFVDHWGKPLYTTLCAPFAQFGFQGALAFNILCGLLAAWFIYRIARELNYRYALIAIPFALFSPIYMITMMTCLTEILFSLVLVAGIYFFLKQKSILAAVIISFIPFARTEGLMFLPMFLAAFLLKKQYKAIPFLTTGYIIFSVAGSFHYKDIFWFFTAMPYGAKGSELYGSGSFFYYINNFDVIMGWPLIILAATGLLAMLFFLFNKNKPDLSFPWITQYFLIIGSFFAFLLVHSFLWWQGMMAVLGSPRFMACIMPLGGLLAAAGVDFSLSFIKEKKWIAYSVLIILTGLIIVIPYRVHEMPSRLIWASQVMKETADALKKLDYTNKRIVFFDPKLTFYLDEDPYDRERFRYRIYDSRKPEIKLPDSSYLVWDTHGGGLEKKIRLEDMLVNPNFRLLDGFVPDEEHILDMVGLNYMSLIFQKLPEKFPPNDWTIIDSNDFEVARNEKHEKYLTDSVSYTGKKSNMLTPGDNLFSISTNLKLEEISSYDKIIYNSRFKVLIPEGADPKEIIQVFEIRDNADKIFRYVVIHASYFNPRPGEWFEMSLLAPMRTDFPGGGTLKSYIWNKSKYKIFVDDHIREYIPVRN